MQGVSPGQVSPSWAGWLWLEGLPPGAWVTELRVISLLLCMVMLPDHFISSAFTVRLVGSCLAPAPTPMFFLQLEAYFPLLPEFLHCLTLFCVPCPFPLNFKC